MSTTVSTSSSTSPSGISFSGLGSGLDIQGIVNQLVNAEGAPQQQLLTSRQNSFNATLSALGQLKSGLSSVQTAVDALKNLDTFRTRTSTVSDTSILNATAIPGTALGTYQVEVDQLASAQKLTSAGFASATSTVGSGTLTFTQGGNSFSVNVGATDTLTTIRDNINAASGNTGVQASIINVDNGSGGTVSKLVFTALNTGSSNAITVTAADSDGNNTDTSGLSQLASNNLTQVSAAQDAIIQIDGNQVTSASNSISSAVTGLTLNLVKAQVGTKVAVTVGVDNGPITTALQTLVTNYNQYQSTYSSLTSYDQSSNQAGALLGDATANGVNNALRALMGQNYNTGSTTVQNLADIGIQVDKNGVMSLDTSKLNQALAADPNAVKTLLTDANNGVSAKVDNLLNPYLQYNGIFDSRTQSINNQLQSITQQQTDLQARLDQYQKSLMSQFTAMDSYVAQMNSSLSFLAKLN
ncbi:hypothetical protein A9404_06855 [Halothiobacillus diazotrophicus]|uniref:Flagellar hook-associated protein 2 n=1 Tax=Halothiobacillus diazotrophicus TaxID=1860122 RepID=A0A191ZKF9_9GAMM|nr:flagellar filament capping protein FliD [Halothiobacillus diazotrophicus]ANJ68333.1 hypothetical protein A9404_06855 [Halothiobacillus diazotrophicus]